MHPAIRQQTDNKGDAYSLRSEINFDPKEDPDARTQTRQEFRDDADINKLLTRFGMNVPTREGAAWGKEIDYSLDLHTAMNAVDAAKAAHRDLPDQLRAKYPTWAELMRALDSGALRLNMSKEKPEKTPTDSNTVVTPTPTTA